MGKSDTIPSPRQEVREETMIKEIKRFFTPDSANITYRIEIFEDAIKPYMMERMCDEIIKGLAEKYLEDFGPEILKRIQEKTIESKVIQKVVENLKKELKGYVRKE